MPAMLSASPLVAFAAITDPERAKSFYGRVLGLRLVHEDEFGLAYDANGTTLRLPKVDTLTPAPYTVLGWRVTDIGAVIEALSAQGVAFERYEGMQQDSRGVWTVPGGGQVAWFKDPEGNLLSLSQPA
jgi:catechol 2,3-dioxygenase-like lactoylglutathione lyase family enzyme